MAVFKPISGDNTWGLIIIADHHFCDDHHKQDQNNTQWELNN